MIDDQQRRDDAGARGAAPSLCFFAAARPRPDEGHAMRSAQDLPTYGFAPIETRAFRVLSSAGDARKITLIEAPPGYGKTVLLTQLYRRRVAGGVEACWVGLDDRETSFIGLLAQVENALGLSHAGRALVENALRLNDAAARIDTVAAFLSSSPKSWAFFIDNINHCTEPGVEKLMGALAFLTPPNVRLFITSSVGAVPFDVTRANLELNLQRIGPQDLSFDRDEIAALFSQAGIEIDDPGVLRSVATRTEGWPAAVRLLQLGARDPETLGQSILALTGENAHVADILSRRLISSLDPGLVVFLLEISLLRYFSAELALDITGDPRAPSWIKLLADRNVMIAPANKHPGFYRFHTLFRQFLDSEAARLLSPQRRRELGVKSALWLMKRGEMQSALGLALRVKDLDLATRVLDEVGAALVRVQGDTAAHIAAVELARAAGAEIGVQATFWYVWALLYERRFSAAFAEVSRATAQLTSGADWPFAAEMRKKLELAAILIAVHRDAPETVQQLAADWASRYPAAEPFETATVAGALACSRLGDHDFMLARRDLIVSQAAIVGTDSEYGRCWVDLLAGMIEIHQGNAAAIEPLLRRVEEGARRKIGAKASIAAIVSLVRARAFYDCARHDEALALVGENLVGACAVGVPDTAWLGVEIALPAAVRGDGPFTLAELRAIVRDYPRRIGALFDMAQIVALAEERRDAEAVDHATTLGWTHGQGWDPALRGDKTEMERSAVRRAAIVLFILSGHLSEASRLIQEEMTLAQKSGRRLAQIELHLLNADVLIRSEARPAALRTLSRAISLAADHMLFSPFRRRASLVRDMLETAPAKALGLTSRAELHALAAISDLVGVQAAPTSSEHAVTAMGRMTPREIELLVLLDAGLDNSQLAQRLTVSVPTVKWHLSNLYGKLDVKNRSAAVAKGRALRLLRR